MLEDELVGNAKSLLEKFNSEKANNKLMGMKLKYNWWTLSAFSKLDKIGGPEFSTWVTEYVPAYRLQINNNKVSNIMFEGWKNTSDHWWEVLLTHSQMVGLANILDMYYEDVFTLPNKQLSCGAITKSTNLSINKRSFSLLKILSTILVSGLALVTISVLGQLCLPYLHNGRKYQREYYSLPSSYTESIHQQSMESTKFEAFAISIISKIKDTLGWPGEIVKHSGGAWTGELPKYLRRIVEADNCGVDFSSITDASEKSDEEIKASAQDIASYQVVLSAEGKIVGIQPTSRVAVNQWAANPLAKELYGGRKLSPGFIEPGLKISCTSEFVLLELLMSVNPDSRFALARPAKL